MQKAQTISLADVEIFGPFVVIGRNSVDIEKEPHSPSAQAVTRTI